MTKLWVNGDNDDDDDIDDNDDDINDNDDNDGDNDDDDDDAEEGEWSNRQRANVFLIVSLRPGLRWSSLSSS